MAKKPKTTNPAAGNDDRRAAAICKIILDKYPQTYIKYNIGLTTHHLQPTGWSKDRIATFIDHSNLDIGGEPEELAISVRIEYTDGTVVDMWISDEEIPPPTLKPMCEATKSMRQIVGIDPMPDWPNIETKGGIPNNVWFKRQSLFKK